MSLHALVRDSFMPIYKKCLLILLSPRELVSSVYTAVLTDSPVVHGHLCVTTAGLIWFVVAESVFPEI